MCTFEDGISATQKIVPRILKDLVAYLVISAVVGNAGPSIARHQFLGKTEN